VRWAVGDPLRSGQIPLVSGHLIRIEQRVGKQRMVQQEPGDVALAVCGGMPQAAVWRHSSGKKKIERLEREVPRLLDLRDDRVRVLRRERHLLLAAVAVDADQRDCRLRVEAVHAVARAEVVLDAFGDDADGR